MRRVLVSSLDPRVKASVVRELARGGIVVASHSEWVLGAYRSVLGERARYIRVTSVDDVIGIGEADVLVYDPADEKPYLAIEAQRSAREMLVYGVNLPPQLALLAIPDAVGARVYYAPSPKPLELTEDDSTCATLIPLVEGAYLDCPPDCSRVIPPSFDARIEADCIVIDYRRYPAPDVAVALRLAYMNSLPVAIKPREARRPS